MRMNDAFPSKYLKAEDLEEGDLIVTISDCRFEEFTDPKTKRPDNKPVLYFEEEDVKPMVLNKTNYRSISTNLGSDDTETWLGKRVALFATEVESFGEMTLGIRVRMKKTAKAAVKIQPAPAAKTQAAPARLVRPQTVPADLDDIAPDVSDIPF